MRVIQMGSDPGQTLVETIVATGLITVALLAIVSLAYSSLTYGGQTADWVTAITLGREGEELCRSIRSRNWFDESQTWPFWLDNGDWIADSDADRLTAASNSNIDNCNNCKICFNSTTKKYFHADDNGDCGSEVLTIYRRLINISSGDDLGIVCPDAPDDCEKKIRVMVKWTERLGPHSIVFESRLTNWR